jgi:phosphoglycerate kinase
MSKLSVRDLEVKGHRVLVRVDFNVPTELVGGEVRITDDTRILESLPTINLLRERGAKVVLLAHFGRPKGRPNPKYSLNPVAQRLGELIAVRVQFSTKTIGEEAEKASQRLAEGEVLLVENVRFHEQEEETILTFHSSLPGLVTSM